MRKLVILTTVPLSLATLVKGQPKYLSQFFDVSLISSNDTINSDIEAYEGISVNTIDMTREITPFRDLKALFQIYVYLLKNRPDIIYSITPKAGLLGMIASFLARVPIRIHNIVGMPLIEASGNKKRVLKVIEKITYFFSTNLFCNSYGLKEYIQQNNFTKKEIKVVANGSINGIDTEFFRDNFTQTQKDELRDSLNIQKDDFVLLFIGRVVKDKGIDELIQAFSILDKEVTNLKLLIVGDFEEHLNPIKSKNIEIMKNNQNIIQVGFQKDIRLYLGISNLFVLPSYREGLPNSLLEAGSFGIPLLATDINGCNEIIIDKENGILIKPKSIKSLVDNITLLLENKQLYNKIKGNIRNSIQTRYNQMFFWRSLKKELESL
jgi:glycosyltransferase involved in cell wall biosynthesis